MADFHDTDENNYLYWQSIVTILAFCSFPAVPSSWSCMKEYAS